MKNFFKDFFKTAEEVERQKQKIREAKIDQLYNTATRLTKEFHNIWNEPVMHVYRVRGVTKIKVFIPQNLYVHDETILMYIIQDDGTANVIDYLSMTQVFGEDWLLYCAVKYVNLVHKLNKLGIEVKSKETTI